MLTSSFLDLQMHSRIKKGSSEPVDGPKLPIERQLSVAAAVLTFLAALVKLLETVGLL